MSKDPNYVNVVVGTLNRVLKQERYDEYCSLHQELLNRYHPVYFVQDDFTMATLVCTKTGKTECVGVSKRNAGDPMVPIRGKSLSLSRAIRAFVLAKWKQVSSVDEAVNKMIEELDVDLRDYCAPQA